MKSFNEWLEARKLNESPGTITKPQPGTETEPEIAPKTPTQPSTPAHPWSKPKEPRKKEKPLAKIPG